MGTSIVVDSQTFATEVLKRSYEKPVLVDFFATWCGPCQMLKPMLEKLVKEYDFVLAKVDIDQNPDLASAYRVEGVPDVRVVVQGEVQPGFVGVLPEADLRALMARLNLHSDLEQELAIVRQAQENGDLEEAGQRLGKLIQKYPDDRTLMITAAQFFLSLGKWDAAESLVAHIQPNEKGFYAKAQAILGLIQFQRESEHHVVASDLDTLYSEAMAAAIAQDYSTALGHLLEIVGRDRKYRQDGARKAMIMLFDLLGDEHPLTKEYRRKLMSTLY
ncbi:MAG TPA: tetratricopeptide repeat protein [Synechococcales cyanobacterium M55_K2018_004]|nr:tetratricopeptide repeat protein [Synechococcales cyanobacterium M55_K2018_004]